MNIPKNYFPPQEQNGEIVANPSPSWISGVNNNSSYSYLLTPWITDGVSPGLNAVEEWNDPEADAMSCGESDVTAD